MKKRVLRTLSLMLVAVMLTAMIPLAAFADSSGVRSMDVCKTSAASMTLDGKVTDGEAWDLVSWSTDPFYTIGGTAAPAGSAVKFKSLWAADGDKAYLYFLINVSDNTLDATKRAWDQDNVRIFLDEDGICEDNVKPVRNDANYGSIYASSEFMSYAPNSYSSKGFGYCATKKENGSGYFIEVQYTYQNAALAVPDAIVRANITAVFGIAANTCAQVLWSWDSEKWSAGLKDKEYFAHAGTLKLTDKTAQKPATPVMTVLRTDAANMTLDGAVTAGEAWDGADWNTNGFTQIGAQPVPEGSAVRFKTLWATDANGSYLYFLIDLDDTILNATGRAWQQDSVRIFLDEDGISEETATPKTNPADYGSAYVSSEFMSYATTANATGFRYKAVKKAGDAGYVIEAVYTFGDFAKAAPDAELRANLAAVFADAENSNNPAQFVWSMDREKWNAGLKNKEYFAHTGTLTLSGEKAEIPAKSIRMDGVQTTSVLGDGCFDARLVAVVDTSVLEGADRIEFLVSATYVRNNVQYTVSEKTYAVNTVFEAFLAGTESVRAAEGEAFALLIIKGVPADVTVTFRVTPRMVYGDAGTATGKTVTFTLPIA